MFMDTGSPGGPGGEPHYDTCRSCKLLIVPGQQKAELHFDSRNPELRKLNGPFHSECAEPYRKVKRAYEMLRMRRPG